MVQANHRLWLFEPDKTLTALSRWMGSDDKEAEGWIGPIFLARLIHEALVLMLVA